MIPDHWLTTSLLKTAYRTEAKANQARDCETVTIKRRRQILQITVGVDIGFDKFAGVVAPSELTIRNFCESISGTLFHDGKGQEQR